VKALFESYPQVEIRLVDWHSTIQNESFDLFVMDLAVRNDLQHAKRDGMIEYIKIDGQVVMHDFIAVELRPADWEEVVGNSHNSHNIRRDHDAH